MTIDEAIAQYKEKAEYFKMTTNVSYALELKQIAEWLEELNALRNGLKIKCDSLNEALEKGKKIGYNKAIDEAIEIVKGNYRMEALVKLEQLKAGESE